MSENRFPSSARSSRYIPLLCLMSIPWAGSYPLFKFLQTELSPGPIVTLRFGVAALAMALAWPFLSAPVLRGRDFIRCIWIGLFVFVLAPRLQVAGVQLGKAGDASVLAGFDPLICSLAAAVFLKERIPAGRWLGFSLGIVGVAMLSEFWKPGRELVGNAAANSMILGSFACEAAYSVLGKPLLARYSAPTILTIALVIATVVNLALDTPALLRDVPSLSAKAWVCLVYLALVSTVVGYLLWYFALREADVNLLALTIFVQPFAGVFFSAVLLGESLHWGQLWGGLAILAGVYVGLRPEKRV